MRKKVIFFSVVIILLVIYVYGILLIRPTFDDFTTLSAPKKDADWLQYFVCYGSTWRPVDALLGYLNGIDTRIFPASNHLIVIAAPLSTVIHAGGMSSGLFLSSFRHFPRIMV